MMLKLPDYMYPGHRTEFLTDAYVSSPPAAFIINEVGKVFTLGFTYQEDRERVNGHYCFNVLVNAQETGEFASHIERRNGKIRIFTKTGYKIWNGKSFI